MIIEYIRYGIPAERDQEFRQAYTLAAAALSESDHCQSYELSQCVEDRTQYVLRIEWDTLEGHMKGFRESKDFKPFFEAVGPFVKSIQEMRHYEATDIKGTGQSAA